MLHSKTSRNIIFRYVITGTDLVFSIFTIPPHYTQLADAVKGGGGWDEKHFCFSAHQQAQRGPQGDQVSSWERNSGTKSTKLPAPILLAPVFRIPLFEQYLK